MLEIATEDPLAGTASEKNYLQKYADVKDNRGFSENIDFGECSPRANIADYAGHARRYGVPRQRPRNWMVKLVL